MKEEIQEIRAENQEMRTKVEQLMDFMHRAEDLQTLCGKSDEKMKKE